MKPLTYIETASTPHDVIAGGHVDGWENNLSTVNSIASDGYFRKEKNPSKKE